MLTWKLKTTICQSEKQPDNFLYQDKLRNRAIGKIEADCIFNFDSENAQLEVSANDKETCLYGY